MALPGNDEVWPPKAEAPRYDRMQTFSVWYAGDPDGLSAHYQNGGAITTEVIENGVAKRAVSAIRRFFWGTPASVGEKQSKIHIPLPQDIATMSSELLFSEGLIVTVDAPKVKTTVDGKEVEVVSEAATKTQERLEFILDKINFKSTLMAAAETGAALGASGLRIGWDKQVQPDYPFIARVDADAIIAEYSWGQLVSVTFWRTVQKVNETFYRHLERHERGGVYHGLYMGTYGKLGMMIPLAEQAATRDLLVDEAGRLQMAVVDAKYRFATSIPNMLPDPMDRANSVGRSDYTPGVISMFDAADETATSLMRDIDLGKGRLIIANYMLEDGGAGKGVSADVDRKIYAPLNMAPGEDGDAPLTLVQFKIRVDEHLKALAYWSNQAMHSAGYNSDVEMGNAGGDMTATEYSGKNKRSLSTRDKKIAYWQNELEALLEALLAVDAAEFGSGVQVFPVKVTWPDAIQPDMRVLAETAKFMRDAKAASDKVIVQTLHPDWDDTQVNTEVEAINAKDSVIDPNAIGLSPQPPLLTPPPTLPGEVTPPVPPVPGT